MTHSKADIDRLGNLIRNESDHLSDETLNMLQGYRTSYREVLSQTFTMLCSKSRQVHPAVIVTYRIKRFESIISKLNRYPEMRFSRMWDIGGCRCILKSNEEVYELRNIIEQDVDFEIIKTYDYIVKPQDDGYKSLHLFLRHRTHENIVEVQLRNQVDHNWATLVEITDVLFECKLKELGDNKELLKFHFLLSKISELTISDKREISKILSKYNYFERLSEVFSRNYVKVRRQWFEIENKNNHKFFLIESNKDDIPKIESFKSSVEAENYYFNVYKARQNANIVLTHLHKPSYSQISIAYSNYVLTFHSFLNECYIILESLIIESLQQKKYYQYFKLYSLYNELIFNHIKNLVAEITEIQQYAQQRKDGKRIDKKKEKEWAADIINQVNKSKERNRNLAIKFRKNMPDSWFGELVVKNITLHIFTKYKTKIEKSTANA